MNKNTLNIALAIALSGLALSASAATPSYILPTSEQAPRAGLGAMPTPSTPQVRSPVLPIPPTMRLITPRCGMAPRLLISAR